MTQMKSREDETLKVVMEAEFPYKETHKYLLLEQIALSLGRIADMLTEQTGYAVHYDNESDEE